MNPCSKSKSSTNVQRFWQRQTQERNGLSTHESKSNSENSTMHTASVNFEMVDKHCNFLYIQAAKQTGGFLL